MTASYRCDDLPMSALNTLVSEAVDLVVHCARTPDGPRVTEVAAVEDLAAGPDATQFTITELFARAAPDGRSPGPAPAPVRLIGRSRASRPRRAQACSKQRPLGAARSQTP